MKQPFQKTTFLNEILALTVKQWFSLSILYYALLLIVGLCGLAINGIVTVPPILVGVFIDLMLFHWFMPLVIWFVYGTLEFAKDAGDDHEWMGIYRHFHVMYCLFYFTMSWYIAIVLFPVLWTFMPVHIILKGYCIIGIMLVTGLTGLSSYHHYLRGSFTK